MGKSLGYWDISMIKMQYKTIYHYLVIYLLIISHGSVIYRNNQDVLLISMFLISSIHIIKEKKPIKLGNIQFIVLLFGVMLLTRITTDGSLSFSSILNIITRFLFAYHAYSYNKIQFVPRFIKLVVFLASCSLLGFIFQILNPSTITSLLPVYYYSGANFYGSIFYTYSSWHPLKNCGLMTEPGLTQIYLNTAFFLVLYYHDKIKIQNQKLTKYIIILSVAILTAQSTTGYFNYIVILATFFLVRKSRENKIKRKLFILSVTILIFFLGTTIYQRDDSFFAAAIGNKIFNVEGKLDLSASTGKSRIVSMQTDLIVALKYPLGAGYDIYNSIWNSYKVEHIGDTSSSSGITYSIAVFGFPFFALLLVYYIKNGLRNSVNKIEFLTKIFLLINTSLSQPLFYYPSFLVLVLIEHSNEKKIESKKK